MQREAKVEKQIINNITFEHPKVFVELSNGYTIWVNPKVLILFYKGKKIKVDVNYEKLIGKKIDKFFFDVAGLTFIVEDFQFNLDFIKDGGFISS